MLFYSLDFVIMEVTWEEVLFQTSDRCVFSPATPKQTANKLPPQFIFGDESYFKNTQVILRI